MQLKHFSFIIIFFFSARAPATLAIPTGLTNGQQELLLSILGFGTSFKTVNNPYPLGGYSGFEMGFTLESLPTGDIGYLGNTAPVDKNLIYPRLSFGKGVFQNFDVFFSFIPYNETTGVGVYSGGLRWGFFQATFVPACFSLLLSGTNSNFNNLFISQTLGIDLISGVNADPFSFYVGAGTLYGQGQFDPSITITGVKTNQVGRSFHALFGASFQLSDVFLALQFDNYTATTVSLKLGLRM